MNQPTARPQALITGLSSSLLAVTRALTESLEAAVEPHGLSLAKLAVLHALVRAGEPLPLGVLTERLGCVKSNVTQLMDRLTADGLVCRLPDARDRRSVLAAITAAGRQRYDVGTRAVSEAEGAFLAQVPAVAREHLLQLLAQFRPG